LQSRLKNNIETILRFEKVWGFFLDEKPKNEKFQAQIKISGIYYLKEKNS